MQQRHDSMMMRLLVTGLAVAAWLAASWPLPTSAQSLEELERQLVQKKAEQARQQQRKAAEAKRDRFEVAAGGIRDREQGVIWAARDNGADVNWTQAQGYCAGLGAGWSLPSVVQLQSLYDEAGMYARSVGSYTIKPATERIQFTGFWYWSAEPDGSARAWLVYLDGGFRFSSVVGDGSGDRALCVRRS